MPSLLVLLICNPPKLKLVGTHISDAMRHRLEQVLPATTTTAVCTEFAADRERPPPHFVRLSNPEHWHIDLGPHFVDQLGRSHIILRLLEAMSLDSWALCGSGTETNLDNGQDTTKFFFYRNVQ